MSSGHHSEQSGPVATDADLTRDRISRVLFFLFALTLSFVLPAVIGMMLTATLFDITMPGMIGGLVAGAWVVSQYLDLFFVRVDSVAAFMTLDQLASLISKKKVYVEYGPGLHISYPWEAREESNNISLEEASESFDMVVQGRTGEILIKGSARLRPDYQHLAQFRSGVASVTDDFVDIIKSYVLQLVASMTIDEAMNGIIDINSALHDKFVGTDQHAKAQEVTDFEARFGVIVGDVTIAEILPSKDAMATRNAVDEATVIAKGAAILLGYSDVAEMNKAKADGKISQSDISTARDRFMAASKNINMNLDAREITFKVDANPDVVDAIKHASPAFVAAMELFSSKKGK